MVSIRFKFIYIVVLGLLAFLFVQSANAQTGFISSNGTVNVQSDRWYFIYDENLDDIYLREFNGGAVPDPIPGTVDAMEIFWSQNFDNTVWFEVLNASVCLGQTRTQCEQQALNTSVWPVPFVPSSNSTWGSDNGFWGTSTTEEVKETLVASVQETGLDLWGLLPLLGVVIAFIIFLQVVFLNKKMVQPVKKSTFDVDKFNSKADELEDFYSRTGGADKALVEEIRGLETQKRKRGRPRKDQTVIK